MGSPIDTWDGVAAYFTGAGGASVGVVFAAAVIACGIAIYLGHRHERHSYASVERD